MYTTDPIKTNLPNFSPRINEIPCSRSEGNDDQRNAWLFHRFSRRSRRSRCSRRLIERLNPIAPFLRNLAVGIGKKRPRTVENARSRRDSEGPEKYVFPRRLMAGEGKEWRRVARKKSGKSGVSYLRRGA